MNRNVDSVVRELRDKGFAYPCTMCRKMWRAHEKGMEYCDSELGDRVCGGPPSGMLFPQYEGPLGDDHMSKHCFACGAETQMVIGGGRIDQGAVGICKRHLPLMDRVVSKEEIDEARKAAEEVERGFVDPYKAIS